MNINQCHVYTFATIPTTNARKPKTVEIKKSIGFPTPTAGKIESTATSLL